jgi:hypothetical protein
MSSKIERFGIRLDQTTLKPDYESTTFSGIYTGQDPEVLTRVSGYMFDTNKTTLNLIAQAPAMLEVLIDVMQCAEYWSEYDVPTGLPDEIKTVIEKALGTPWAEIKEIWRW